MNRNWIITGVAAVCLLVGTVLSHRIEPGVRVENLMLTPDSPALRIFPATPGPHPLALLAHGNGASKEMLFRFSEALAAAGFDCYSIDEAGYGASPLSVSRRSILFSNFRDTERALGPVDVFIGHSMGGAVGGWAVRRAGFRPRLFIAVGMPVTLGEHGPPLLLLGGLFEEFFRPAQLRARTDAQVVISPWSDHLLEPHDPVLIDAAVKAVCAAVGKPAPAPPTAWRWRLAGLALGIAGALALMFCLPALHPRLARIRRFLVPAVLLLALYGTLWPWWGMHSHVRRIPAHLMVLAVVWLLLLLARRLRMPQWTLPLVTGILALGCIPLALRSRTTDFSTPLCALAIGTLCLFLAVAVGRIASRGGSRRDGDISMALFASYVIGQFIPLFY